MSYRKLPTSWKPNNTYDYVPAEEWMVGDDSDLYSVVWEGPPRSSQGFDRDWTLHVTAAAIGHSQAGQAHKICLVLQVTSCEKDAFRIRFAPYADAPLAFPDKVYGPVVSSRLDTIRQHEKQRGYAPVLHWGRKGASIQLRSISIDFVADNGHLSIKVRRLSDNGVIDISSGPLWHAEKDIGTVANMEREAKEATHYFGLGGILDYNLTSSVDPEEGSSETNSYSRRGRSALDRKGMELTCYNYDNLWYNQPEVFPRSVAYKDTFKANYNVPQYLNAPFYIERSVINEKEAFLGAFLDNTGQTFFSLKSIARGHDKVVAAAQHGEFDCHYMYGQTANAILDAYTYLMGQGTLADEAPTGLLNRRSVMPPKYIFGYFQAKYGCRGLLRPQDDTDKTHVYVEDIVHGYRDAALPLEGLGIDIDVQEDKKVFTIKNSFWAGGTVGSGKSVFDWASDYNLQCQTNVTPFARADKKAYDPSDPARVQYETAKGLIEQDYCVQNEGEANIPRFRGPRSEADYPGLTYTTTDGVRHPEQNIQVLDYGVNAQTGERDIIGAVVADFGKPEAARFWGDQYPYLFSNGLGFLWQDMPDPDAMPHVEDGDNFADTASPRNQFGWSLTGEAPTDDRRRSNTFNWRSYHGQLHLTDPRFGDGRKTPFVELRNFHAYMLARSSYEFGLEAHADLLKHYKRSYIICRSGYPGLQHYSGHWIGDNASTWHHLQVSLPQILNLGLSATPIAGADLGGFAPGEDHGDPANTFYGEQRNRNHNPAIYNRLVLGPEDIDIGAISEPELMTRWTQAAALQPWVRNHYDAMKQYQEVYNYMAPATADGAKTFGHIMGEFVRFRVRWHHLLYDAMYENTQTGAPINRAMCLWDGDPEIFSDTNRDILGTQFFIAGSVLVAPILTKSPTGRAGSYLAETEVYFPRSGQGRATKWFRLDVVNDLIDGEHPISGGQRVSVTAKIDSLPIFIKEGAIIPERHYLTTLDVPFKNIQALDKHDQPLVLSLYPPMPGPDNDEGYSHTLYWDDGGVSRDAELTGKFSVIDVRQSGLWNMVGSLERTIELDLRRYQYRLPRYVYLRVRSANFFVQEIVVSGRTVKNVLASRDALFEYAGEGLSIDQDTASIWIKIETAELDEGQTLAVRLEG
ncbi:Alpha-glucosidase 2 [Neorhizobium galegae bv. orientalis]|nr:Alpha-glucosidase 2 [Neorhizobium galegae bv. orientalis]